MCWVETIIELPIAKNRSMDVSSSLLIIVNKGNKSLINVRVIYVYTPRLAQYLNLLLAATQQKDGKGACERTPRDD